MNLAFWVWRRDAISESTNSGESDSGTTCDDEAIQNSEKKSE